MRKLCTRQHFIEYLSYNYVEKQCLLARCIWRRDTHDHGVDGFFRSYSEAGALEKGMIEVQAKATDHIDRYRKDEFFVFDLEVRDLTDWLIDQRTPIVLVLYDAEHDIGYYLDLGAYFRAGNRLIKKTTKFVRVKIPVGNILNPASVNQLKITKNSFA